MDVLEAIKTRRSIRKYTDEAVTREAIINIITAGMYAPSAGNQRVWHFIVVDDKKILSSIPDWHPHANMLRYASCAIVVCADTNAETHKGYWVQDCSAATQNMLLAIHGLGLGGVWLGIHPRPERIAKVKEMFNLPLGVEPLCIIAIGHPAVKKPPEERFEPHKIHWNRW